MKVGIVDYKDELMIKIWDDFDIGEIGDNTDGVIITLKKENARELANKILKELKKEVLGE